MLKCVPFEGDFNNIPSSLSNTYDALLKLGELAPDRVKRKVLGKNYSKIIITELPHKVLFKLGILYVRLSLNRHLGKSGKYTNRLIRMVAISKTYTTPDQKIHIISMVPKKEYFKVISCIYCLLRGLDYNFSNSLECRYSESVEINNPVLKCILPIPTNIVLRSVPERNDGKKLKKYILYIEGRVV